MIESLIPFEAITIRDDCQALGVSESGFYAHRHKPQRPRRQQDERIVHEMKQVFEQNYHCYGSPRLVKALKHRGFGSGFWVWQNSYSPLDEARRALSQTKAPRATTNDAK